MLINFIKTLTLYICICSSAFAYIEHGKYSDYRKLQNIEVKKMQEFHLQQAKNKIHAKQLIHAWGDLAYLLCHVPNHHLALRQMIELATPLHKEQELQEYFTKALSLYPEDDVVHMLYGVFLFNKGDITKAYQELDLANLSNTDVQNLSQD